MTDKPALLGGLEADDFMRRYWQRRPLLIRGASRAAPLVDRKTLFNLAGREDVESRLIVRDAQAWSVRHGPIGPRQRPSLKQPGWTLLVQGVDLHLDAASALLQQFAFIPWARADDVMVSFATDEGGVGPHTDEYDVFLLQLEGRRRWSVGPVAHPVWQPDVPLKLLARFKPDQTWVLEPGDMLYLPPGWGHDGVALGSCTTASVGFRAPRAAELARALMARLADDDAQGEALDGKLAAAGRYRDVERAACAHPGAVPKALALFAQRSVQQLAAQPGGIDMALGEWLTEPKPTVFFDPLPDAATRRVRRTRPGLVLDRRTRMLYDERRVYINGEAFDAAGRDARVLQRLADERLLTADAACSLSPGAWACIVGWIAAGWVHATSARGGRAGTTRKVAR